MARGSAFIRSVALVPERVGQPDAYPFSIPAVKALRQGELELDAGLTFLVGEIGSGKSTLIEAVAVAAGGTALHERSHGESWTSPRRPCRSRGSSR